MSRILFSPESFNMGETTRCIEIARVARERGHTVLFHVYSPKYLGLLESAGLPVHLREPIMSDAEAEQIMALDQGRGVRHPFTTDMVRRRVAAELGAFQGDAIGRMIVGARQVGTLEARPGIVLLQFPKLDLPPAGTPASEWTVMQRVSAAVIRGALSWVTTSAKDPALRPLRKLVVVPEAHLFTATQEGAAFLDQTARLGRALGASLAIDSQDPTSIAERDGIMEQIVTVFAFSQKTRKQQDAVAEILGLAPSDQVRAILSSINTNPAGGVWHGHCIMRDARDRVATIQVAIPNRAVARALDTTPRRTP